MNWLTFEIIPLEARLVRQKDVNFDRIGTLRRPLVDGRKPQTVREARACLDLYQSQRQQRYDQLSDFLSDNGVHLGDTNEDARKASQFYTAAVNLAEDGEAIDKIWSPFM